MNHLKLLFNKHLFKQHLTIVLIGGVLLVGGTCTMTVAHGAITSTGWIEHAANSGGEDRKTISLKTLKKPLLRKGQCATYKNATLKYKKRHLGEAKIIKPPKKGCNPNQQLCELVISWKHAPAGWLIYKIDVDWDISNTGC